VLEAVCGRSAALEGWATAAWGQTHLLDVLPAVLLLRGPVRTAELVLAGMS